MSFISFYRRCKTLHSGSIQWQIVRIHLRPNRSRLHRFLTTFIVLLCLGILPIEELAKVGDGSDSVR